MPKDIQSAFLSCKVKNTSNYLLLAGQANVFFNGNFVAKSQIPHVSPQERFSCSLGVDPAIRIMYHPQSKKVKSSGASFLSPFAARTTTTSYEQVVTIRNTRLSQVHRLLLKEQIPVSRDARIKVNVLEPCTLTTGLWTGRNAALHVMDGVEVHWASKREDGNDDSRLSMEELTAEAAQGIIEWVAKIEPGASLDVNLAWEVVSPAEIEWFMQD